MLLRCFVCKWQTWERERREYGNEIMLLQSQNASLKAELRRRDAQLHARLATPPPEEQPSAAPSQPREPFAAPSQPLEEAHSDSPVSRPLSISPCSSGSDIETRETRALSDPSSRTVGLRQRLVIAENTHRRLQRESTLTKVLLPQNVCACNLTCRISPRTRRTGATRHGVGERRIYQLPNMKSTCCAGAVRTRRSTPAER